MSIDKSKSLSREVLRFLATGIVCALLDFLACQGMLMACASLDKWAAQIIATAIGFIIGVIVNYLLSTYWVFQNVKDKKATKTKKFIALFVLFSFVGLLLSIGVMSLCQWICDSCWGIKIWESQFNKIWNFDFWTDVAFWAYFISFCIRTIVGLVWNYFTRKKFLYKAPKESEEIVNGN